MKSSKPKSRRSNKRKPIPLTKKPVKMKSRKRARQVTTRFHKLTHEREMAMKGGHSATVQRLDKELQDMGGRSEYQRASQLSTTFHSTSKWVLGNLAQRGWLYGIVDAVTEDSSLAEDKVFCRRKRSALPRRPTRLLEVGAINTEMLDAAAEKNDTGDTRYRLDVRAIDLHSMEERIEEADFLTLPYCDDNVDRRYDVIVCSMVINCVPTPKDRGKMMARLFHHLRPGGLLFLTLPKYCLTRSAFVTLAVFKEMLGRNGGVGFEVEETKQSPKVAFYICRRPEFDAHTPIQPLSKVWNKETIRNKGKKFPNQFSVLLDPNEVAGVIPSK